MRLPTLVLVFIHTALSAPVLTHIPFSSSSHTALNRKLSSQELDMLDVFAPVLPFPQTTPPRCYNIRNYTDLTMSYTHARITPHTYLPATLTIYAEILNSLCTRVLYNVKLGSEVASLDATSTPAFIKVSLRNLKGAERLRVGQFIVSRGNIPGQVNVYPGPMTLSIEERSTILRKEERKRVKSFDSSDSDNYLDTNSGNEATGER